MSEGRRLVCAALALFPIGCGDEGVAPPAPLPPVMVERATAHVLVDGVEATGQLLAKAEATVAAQVAGEITAVAADEGAAVALGQVIVEIDPDGTVETDDQEVDGLGRVGLGEEEVSGELDPADLRDPGVEVANEERCDDGRRDHARARDDDQALRPRPPEPDRCSLRHGR